MSPDEWATAFKAATTDIGAMDVDSISYNESADRMRTLLKTGLLRHTDLRDNPERFFLAHRLLASYAPKLGPGFWIRFTVHYNLCTGTVLGLGGEDQLQELETMQDQGLLGCFSLTERLAGVSSGLVVNTKATWDPVQSVFHLSSPDDGAVKNWISQGLVADKTVVMADLVIGGKPFGPHAFFMNLRENGNVVSGVSHGDMGKKTVGNDLDNAWISFNNVTLPKSALLNRYADIDGTNYIQKVKGVPVFHMIGQRLFTGRVAVAQAALEFRRSLFSSTKSYADKKECWDPRKNRLLSSLPQLKSLFEENEANQTRMDAFVGKCETEMCTALKSNSMPSFKLVEAIAVAKVKAVEDSIKFVHRLQNEVGSYALMKGTGFEQTDFLTCCKFAEGDSRVLMQKMTRDRVKLFRDKQMDSAEMDEEMELCSVLVKALQNNPTTGWDDNFQIVYKLADTIMHRVMVDFLKK